MWAWVRRSRVSLPSSCGQRNGPVCPGLLLSRWRNIRHHTFHRSIFLIHQLGEIMPIDGKLSKIVSPR